MPDIDILILMLNIVHCDVQQHRRLKFLYCKFYNVCVEQRFGYT